MSIDLNKSPDYELLIATLLNKTKDGKLSWHETANENTFVASVKGKRTFKISRHCLLGSGFDVTLTVEDADGKNLIVANSCTQTSYNLFNLARRLAMNIDENLESTVELLQQL